MVHLNVKDKLHFTKLKNINQKRSLMKNVLIAITVIGACVLSPAQAGENIVYGGVGTSSVKSPVGYGNLDASPWSVGWLHTEKVSPLVLGLDYSQEGVRYDITWGQRSIRRSNSYNVLIGAKVADNGVVQLNAAAVIGTREANTSCPASYLGYRCYANQDPDVKYKFNYGGMLTLSYRTIMVGVRVTDVSNQMVVGLRF